MKILVDEMPLFEQDCPFYTGYECSLDRTKCEHMHLSTSQRCYKTECKWLKAKGDGEDDD